MWSRVPWELALGVVLGILCIAGIVAWLAWAMGEDDRHERELAAVAGDAEWQRSDVETRKLREQEASKYQNPTAS